MFAVLLITLGLGQLISTYLGWRAASLVGARRGVGYGLGLLLLAGSFIDPPPHPDCLFEATHPAHGSCRRVQIPDGNSLIPGYLLSPPTPPYPPLSGGGVKEEPTLYPSTLPPFHPSTLPPLHLSTPPPFPTAAVLVVHGAGDTKTSYKWRLVGALLAEGLTVLTIDLPGHGDYRQRPLAYPDCLSAAPAALHFLRAQPGVERVGLVGISLGSALAIASLAQNRKDLTGLANLSGLAERKIDAFAGLETPVELRYSRGMYYEEMWHAYRAPVLSLFGEVSVKQLRQSWFTGGYVSRHKNTAEVIDLLNPLANIACLPEMPILLVHGRRDAIAPPAAGEALRQAAPHAELWKVKGASHVTLTLMPQVNRQVARWLREKLEDSRW